MAQWVVAPAARREPVARTTWPGLQKKGFHWARLDSRSIVLSMARSLVCRRGDGADRTTRSVLALSVAFLPSRADKTVARSLFEIY
jgi:hypothetical protein